MRKIMDLIANELAAAFEAAGYDKEYAPSLPDGYPPVHGVPSFLQAS